MQTTLTGGDEGAMTPWGPALAVVPHAPGIRWVEGEGGAGLLLTPRYAAAHLPERLVQAATTWGGWLTYQKGRGAARVAVHLSADVRGLSRHWKGGRCEMEAQAQDEEAGHRQVVWGSDLTGAGVPDA